MDQSRASEISTYTSSSPHKESQFFLLIVLQFNGHGGPLSLFNFKEIEKKYREDREKGLESIFYSVFKVYKKNRRLPPKHILHPS